MTKKKTAKKKIKESSKAIRQFLLRMCKQIKKAQALSNENLILKVIGNIWAVYRLDSAESAYLYELIERFKKKMDKSGKIKQ